VSAPTKPRWAFAVAEDTVAFITLGLVLGLSLSEVIARTFFRSGVPSSAALVSHFTLAFASAGAAIAGREGRQLGLADAWNPRGLLGATLVALRSFFSLLILSSLAISSLSMVLQAFDPTAAVGFLPTRFFAAAVPLSFGVMTVRTTIRAWRKRPAVVVLALAAGIFASSGAISGMVAAVIGDAPSPFWVVADAWTAFSAAAVWPLALVILASTVAGVPLFLALAGVAYVAFAGTMGAVEVVPFAGYSMLTGNIIPAIPLFTLAGYVLADSGAGKRLVALIRALFGWVRGGPAIAAVVVSAFFTTFTGASGVTILALGGILAFILKENGYREDRAEGLLTASGAIGLLFPPSLAIIVYGSVAQVSIADLFIGGLIPGVLLVATIAVAGVVGDTGGHRTPFVPKAALTSFRDAIGELLLPALVLIGYFSGFFTLVETGAFAAAYVIVLEVFIRRDISLRGFPETVLKSVPVTGGVLIILAAARGLSDFLVDAQVPMFLVQLAQDHIPSKLLFLALLNVLLLIVGTLMDLFSAILVVAPLVIPPALAFGINPVHLGVIFLTNLGLGFLTPPVGMNLFIASYAFGKPLNKITRSVLPYLGLQLLVLIAVTYIPVLTTVFLRP
jgi:C4-dicarboxylate transporter, DctM subunit